MWTVRKSRKSLKRLRRYGRIHRPWLAKGICATLGLVLLRLAVPWPLKGVIDVLLPHPEKKSLLAWVPSSGDPVLWFVGAFVLLILGVGISEMIQRVCMAKFATHT